MNIKNFRNIYFLGIGGVSMSGFAKLLKNEGHNISGYDCTKSDNTTYLESICIKVDYDHTDSNITKDLDLVVYSSAIKMDSFEILEAKKLNIPIISRSQLIGTILKEYKNTLCISGTHGKTTTTALTSTIFIDAQKNPTISVGGYLPKINGVFNIGDKENFILEACEYKNNFHNFICTTALIMNIEMDHSDFFQSVDEIYDSFNTFAKKALNKVIINKDIKNYEKVLKDVTNTIVTYSIEDETSDYYLKNVSFNKEETSFSLYYKGELLENYTSSLKGIHNLYNALSSLVLSIESGILPSNCKEGLKNFTGINRRFQFKGKKENISVYDDYAHHPTACNLILDAVDKIEKDKLVCVFQPHTFSRTISLFDEFSKAFEKADKIILIDIYPAREIDTGVVNSSMLVDKINEISNNAIYMSSKEDCLQYLKDTLKGNDLLLTLGAGDVYKIGEDFLNK